MRLVTFEHEGRQHLGLVFNDSVTSLASLALAHGADASLFSDMIRFLSSGERSLETAQRLQDRAVRDWDQWVPLSRVKLLSPVPKPGKIVAVGLNYRDHAEEAKLAIPAEPLFFAKFTSSITGPFAEIILPAPDINTDFEGELAVVIGTRARRVASGEALRHVAGYAIMNDVSARKWQFADKQWTRAKSCDTYSPCGPWLTTRDEVPDPQQLRITTRVNGNVMQDSNTNRMIFSVARLIEHITEAITLEPGDIIATGTPAGVGVFCNPQVFLKAGDTVEVEIEKLGSIKNPVRNEVRA